MSRRERTSFFISCQASLTAAACQVNLTGGLLDSLGDGDDRAVAVRGRRVHAEACACARADGAREEAAVGRREDAHRPPPAGAELLEPERRAAAGAYLAPERRPQPVPRSLRQRDPER